MNKLPELIKDLVLESSYTLDSKGCLNALKVIESELESIADSIEWTELKLAKIYQNKKLIETPVGRCLIIQKRPNALKKVLLSGHIDTVYKHLETEFNISNGWCYAPGIADMKSGLYVFIRTLLEFEKITSNDSIGWTFIISSDEEIGSPISKHILKDLAKDHDHLMICEPALENGSMILNRSGSFNIVIESYGTGGHAGRNQESGISAINQLIKIAGKLESLCEKSSIINIGEISGGTGANVLAEYANAFCNIRSKCPKMFFKIEQGLNLINDTYPSIDIHFLSKRNVKKINTFLQDEQKLLEKIGQKLNMKIQFEDTFGVCDGNTLMEFNLYGFDTFGPWGKGLHSKQEAVFLPSIKDKIDLCINYLYELDKSYKLKSKS